MIRALALCLSPQDFANAKRYANRVGFTIGNCEGLGHGGTGPAILTITSFDIK
jgi:hypothetical protein